MDNGLIVDDLAKLIQKKIDDGELKTEKIKPTVSITGKINDIHYPEITITDCNKEKKHD